MIGQLTRAAVSLDALERIRSSATDDAGLHRLLTHVIDEAHIRQAQPADVVANTELPALIAATGMPAAALTPRWRGPAFCGVDVASPGASRLARWLPQSRSWRRSWPGSCSAATTTSTPRTTTPRRAG